MRWTFRMDNSQVLDRQSARIVRGLSFVFLVISAAATLFSLLSNLRFSHSIAVLERQLYLIQQRDRINSPSMGAGITVVEQYQKSICFVYTSYTSSYRDLLPQSRSVAGTSFVIKSGMMATNRHIVEPWWDDENARALRHAGTLFRVNRIVAFCPGITKPITLTGAIVSSKSDVAVIQFTLPDQTSVPPLPLADREPKVGDPVTVLGYPAGVVAMLAKSFPVVRASITSTANPISMMRALAMKGLLRPLATYGRLGDVTDYTLVYDAHTAPGGSGGPVIDSHAQVIGINAAFMPNFTGENLGVPVKYLKLLLEQTSD